MERTYFALIGKREPDEPYGLIFPSFPGCTAAGATFEEVERQAKEALALHVECLLEDGESIPSPEDFDEVLAWKDNEDSYLCCSTLLRICIDLPDRIARRINITVPEFELDRIDAWAKAHGIKRSTLMARATLEYIEQQEKER